MRESNFNLNSINYKFNEIAGFIDATIDIDKPSAPNKYPAKNNQEKNKNAKFHVYGNLKL